MRLQSVSSGELLRDRQGEGMVQAALAVDARQLAQFGLRFLGQFLLFAGDVGFLGVRLSADRDVLARRHRHGPRDQPGKPSDEDRPRLGVGRRDADDQAGGRDDAVIGPQHRRAHPADPRHQVLLAVAVSKTGHEGFRFFLAGAV